MENDVVDTHGLADFVRTTVERKELASEQTKAISEAIRDHAEDTGVNKRALGWLIQLHRMKPENRADVIRSLEIGLETMKAEWNMQADFLDDAA